MSAFIEGSNEALPRRRKKKSIANLLDPNEGEPIGSNRLFLISEFETQISIESFESRTEETLLPPLGTGHHNNFRGELRASKVI